MSFSTAFDMFRESSRIVFNDRFMGDEGAKQLAHFLSSHGRVQSLEIKSNDISATGFIMIFQALLKNPNLRQLIIEYNNLGQNQYENWQDSLGALITRSPKLQRLNISNNKINGEGFGRISYPICQSKSLKLLQIRYNAITSAEIESFLNELKSTKNDCLLFVETAGNKVKRESLDNLQAYLKKNRMSNPISKDKLLMTGGFYDKVSEHSKSHSNLYKNNSVDDLSKQNVIKHLEGILDQNRKDTAQMKVRLQNELAQLVKREKLDAKELSDLDSRCNEIIIQNRNLKYELDRTVSEHQQLERDQEYHMRVHEEKLREANKQIQDLQSKFQDVEGRMNKEHEMKMKQIARQWQGRLRTVQQKIRTAQNDSNSIENQIRRHLQKRQRLRVEYVEEENIIRARVQEQQAQRYGLKLSALQSKLKQIEESRERYIRRNQDLVYEIEVTQKQNQTQIVDLEEELENLKIKEEEFSQKNKDFLNRNEKLKSEIKLKEINIQKLEEQINRLNEQITLKKNYNREQVDRIIGDNQYDRTKQQEEKQVQIQKLTQLQTTLRNSQLENAKLRQQYAILAQKLQITLGKAVQEVFAQNNLY